MTNLEIHAEREMRLAGLYDADSDYGGMIPDSVMKLIRAMAGDGHSGGSAALVVSIFTKLANFQALSPLTDDPTEWCEVSRGIWQSKRQSSCFSEDGGKTFNDIDSQEPKAKKATVRKCI